MPRDFRGIGARRPQLQSNGRNSILHYEKKKTSLKPPLITFRLQSSSLTLGRHQNVPPQAAPRRTNRSPPAPNPALRPIRHSLSAPPGTGSGTRLSVHLPRPDPKYAETIFAVPRTASGKSISANERKAGRVPSIVFEQEDGQHGGNKRLISVRTNQIRKLVGHLGRSFFLSRLFDLEVRSDFDSEDDIVERVRVLPRMIHLHSATDAPLNVTFIRAPSHALLKVDIPLVFRGDDVSPGLKKGAYLNTIKRTVKFLCPADVIPPYIDVDLSELDVGQKILMGDLKVHPTLKLIQSKDEPVCKITGARVSEQKKTK
ncbi:Ribosomal protein L25/Gln-tRNA synthetase with anti-codon-binding domain [Prunus dulcis]|uniref:Ribosomal protein L25/Gln-tRNA synthetase with anti-codon-binding domain n=1 Tax=Prunus dulcis TaxID=3755 RepID=A0A4Y1QLW6_PRUDU|nr:Ribosomal protein L25/Gln-tRNA synthetase with anti-codon-binding domain [Prunus dulcis]